MMTKVGYNDYISYLFMSCFFKCLQWNLTNPATLRTNESGWISEVAGFPGTLLMYKRMDQSFGA